MITPDQKKEDKTTLIVTSTPDPEGLSFLNEYVTRVMPMLLNAGGVVVKRTEVTRVFHGDRQFTYLLVMDFPSDESLNNLFESEAYQQLIKIREKGFVNMNILYGRDL
ncbi:DUF1330 domain-containing protein [Roseivirga sp.]|uniref:DUF1330 domain-containing protein n=1 Tax=Roseivirga sp. TaxID=1964215 RepID=UPI003B523B56